MSDLLLKAIRYFELKKMIPMNLKKHVLVTCDDGDTWHVVHRDAVTNGKVVKIKKVLEAM